MTESGLKLIVWLVAAGLTGAMLAIPQPVDPWEMPSLVLDRAAVSDAIRLDEALAHDVKRITWSEPKPEAVYFRKP